MTPRTVVYTASTSSLHSGSLWPTPPRCPSPPASPPPPPPHAVGVSSPTPSQADFSPPAGSSVTVLLQRTPPQRLAAILPPTALLSTVHRATREYLWCVCLTPLPITLYNSSISRLCQINQQIRSRIWRLLRASFTTSPSRQLGP